MPLLNSIVSKAYKITTSKIKRGLVPLKPVPVAPSEVNPIIDWVNQRSDVNTAANAVTGNATTATINTVSGTITAPMTTASGGANSTSYTVNNSACTANSTVLVSISNYTGGANGVPLILRVVPAAGSFVIVVRNLDTVNNLSGNTVFKFIIL